MIDISTLHILILTVSQIAAAVGATVISTSSSDAKLAIAQKN